MDAEELLVHDGRQRQAIKGRHASLIDGFRVLDLACRGGGDTGQVARSLHIRKSTDAAICRSLRVDALVCS